MKSEDIGAYYESILENEVRKEGGIYYAPPFIVDYIVKHSLGELLKNVRQMIISQKQLQEIQEKSFSEWLIAIYLGHRFL